VEKFKNTTPHIDWAQNIQRRHPLQVTVSVKLLYEDVKPFEDKVVNAAAVKLKYPKLILLNNLQIFLRS
jgi:hypothetical protein